MAKTKVLKFILKSDLAQRLAIKTRKPEKETLINLNLLLGIIVEKLAQGERLEFRDFGIFSTRVRAARVRHNPKTLEKIAAAAKVAIHFKPGKALRENLKVDGES